MFRAWPQSFVYVCLKSDGNRQLLPVVFNVYNSFRSAKLSQKEPLLHLQCRGIKTEECIMSKNALVILAPGAEEMEFVISADVLRRAGVNVTVAGLKNKECVKCSRDVVIVPDTMLESVKNEKFDAVVMPGGLGGSKAMAEDAVLGELLKQQEAEGRIIAAICAAPTALAAHNIGTGKCLTSYPSVKAQLVSKYKYVDDQNVVQDGNLITSRGPGTAFAFGLKLAEVLAGCDKAKEVAKGMLLD